MLNNPVLSIKAKVRMAAFFMWCSKSGVADSKNGRLFHHDWLLHRSLEVNLSSSL
jgi:hypothetical protein